MSWSQLELFAEASPASPSVLPGSEQARKMTATSGRKCSALSKSSSPLGWLVRTCLESTDWRSTRCWLTWKPAGTKSRHRLKFRLVHSTRGMSGSECGFWATPKAQEDGREPEAWFRARERHYETRKAKGTSSGGPAGIKGSLAVMVKAVERGLLPTPKASDADRGGRGDLLAIVKGHPNSHTGGPQETNCERQPGMLNPEWVEWLMGYPAKWTELEDLETPSSPP